MIFDMTLYKPTELEMWICQKYLDNGIMTPADMDINQIGEIFETFITYKDGGKTKVLYDDTPGAMVFLNIHDSESTQRLKFFHELGHPAMHSGSQNRMPRLFVDLQEAQAGAFQLYAAIPYYMLAEITPCHTYAGYYNLLADLFRLPLPFVRKRIDQVKRRMLQGLNDRNMHAQFAGVSYRYGYSDETLRLLGKLHQQLSKQKEALGQ